MPLLRAMRGQIASSYLLSHVDNPVDWWMWGPDAFEHARTSDRLIFLSVGYSACHWCHVMAHESFEDPSIAQQLNDNFVSIKVDREERPDVDALYMAATQLVSGQGGWPMSVFLLPDGKPFMAGTYYPPVDRVGHVGFPRLLETVTDAWIHERERIVEQASQLHDALEREVRFIDGLVPWHGAIDRAVARERLRDELVARTDVEGGFGRAPKFPRPSYVDALLESDDDDTQDVVRRTLDSMSRRGIYDHLRGGFARYSVDDRWHIPHFEKMLSDQALLARSYLRAARARPDHDEWRLVALETLRFVLRDLALEDGFASSLDADANGVEGSHVTWTPDEVAEALAREGCESDLGATLSRWQISDPGEFEGRSIPMLGADEPFTTPPALERAADALRHARARRAQPSRDEKVILEWNAMLASALLRSGDAQMQRQGFELLDTLVRTHFFDGTWWRTERHQAYATAADVAWTADATVDAFEVSGDDQWLDLAENLTSYLLDHHWDGPRPTPDDPHHGQGVFAECDLVRDLSIRTKDVFDGATPSSHAISCRALARLGLCRADQTLLVTAQRLVELAGSLVIEHPSAVPDLLEAAGFALDGVEIVIPGAPNDLAIHVRSKTMSSSVLITGSGSSPLLANRLVGLAYVCRGGVCQLPVSSAAQLNEQLERMGA